MDKAERHLFKTERERLRRTQTDVERKSGIGQGLISRIEIDPTYNPTVAVFKKAVTGIDLTLSTFYAQIEGIQTQSAPALVAVPPAENVDGPPYFDSEERIAQKVLRRLAQLALRGGPRERAEDHRLPAIPRALAAERRAPTGKNRQRHVRGLPKRRSEDS